MRLYHRKTLAYGFGLLGSGTLVGLILSFKGMSIVAGWLMMPQYVIICLSILAGSVAIWCLIGWIKYLYLFIRYRDLTKDIRAMGDALLITFVRLGIITSSLTDLSVSAEIDHEGAIYCHLEGGTTFEKSAFITALQEIIGPVQNPRYVIVTKSTLFDLIHQKAYHAVPELIGRQKSSAEYFSKQWRRLVGRCDLTYTRTIAGRKLLLKSRIASLAARFEDPIEHLSKWR